MMTLQAFLKQKHALSKAHRHQPYWEAKQRQWLSAVQELYDDIQKWLQSSIKQGVVTVKTTPITITEPYLGSYDVEKLEIQVGEETVSIDPQGVELANILGEVVMRGPVGQAKLWLMPAGPALEKNNRWYLVSLFTGVTEWIGSLPEAPQWNEGNDIKKKLPVLNRNQFAKILMSILRPNIDES